MRASILHILILFLPSGIGLVADGKNSNFQEKEGMRQKILHASEDSSGDEGAENFL